jgi:hypothetical protein
VHVAAVGTQVENRVPDNLPWSVICDVAAAAGFRHRDAERCKAIRVGDDVRTAAVAAYPNGDDRWVLEQDEQIRHTIGSAFLDQRTLQCERLSVWDDT